MRKGFLFSLLWTVLFQFELPPLYSRVNSAFVVQILGPLFTIDRGSTEGIQPFSIYKIYRYDMTVSVRQPWIYVGFARTTQVFSNISILKYVEKDASSFLAISDAVALYFVEEEPEPTTTEIPSKVIVEEIPDKEYKRPLEEPSLQWNVSRKTGSPMGFGIQAVAGFQNIPEFVTNSINDYIHREIYIVPPVTTQSTKIGIGQSFTLQRYFPQGFTLRGEYSHIVFKGELRSEISNDAQLPSSLPPEYVKEWDFALKTTLNNFSISIIRGGLKRVVDIMDNNPNSTGFSYHWGTGVDYASLNYSADTRTILIRDGRDRIINDQEKFPRRFYWGAHAVLGIDYISGFGNIFIESGITWWKTSGLKYSYPTRVGVIIYF